MPTHHLQPKDGKPKDIEDNNICFFGQTNYRNQMRTFGMKLDDRRRHTYVIGKTGMGKTTLMENMVLHDIYNGNGVGIVDPHGDFSEKIINYIPSHRINDVIYFNPADVEFPVGFNILEVQDPAQKHLIAQGLMATFKKIWPDTWSSRMEYILNNTLLALLDYPGSTLLGINRLLGDKKFRKKVVAKLTDPVIKAFWEVEFAQYNDKYASEAVAPIQNKIGQFLSASVIRNMVAQVKSTIDIRAAMDSKKILIMNLSKGRIGEDNSRLLGGMLITKIQLSAMERVDTPEADRKDFFLYVDEFQNFATPSFANILSEARKYRLGLIMAHQYVAQLDEIVADAVFGNVGTLITFRVGATDAEFLAKEFLPTFTEEDIINLPKFQIFLKLMIDGVSSAPFSASSLPPIGQVTNSREKIIKISRERYANTRESIEDKINRWSGGEGDSEGDLEVASVIPKPFLPNKTQEGKIDTKVQTSKSEEKKGDKKDTKKLSHIKNSPNNSAPKTGQKKSDITRNNNGQRISSDSNAKDDKQQQSNPSGLTLADLSSRENVKKEDVKVSHKELEKKTEITLDTQKKITEPKITNNNQIVEHLVSTATSKDQNQKEDSASSRDVVNQESNKNFEQKNKLHEQEKNTVIRKTTDQNPIVKQVMYTKNIVNNSQIQNHHTTVVQDNTQKTTQHFNQKDTSKSDIPVEEQKIHIENETNKIQQNNVYNAESLDWEDNTPPIVTNTTYNNTFYEEIPQYKTISVDQQVEHTKRTLQALLHDPNDDISSDIEPLAQNDLPPHKVQQQEEPVETDVSDVVKTVESIKSEPQTQVVSSPPKKKRRRRGKRGGRSGVQKSIGESTHGGVQKIEPKYTVPQPKNNTQQSSQNNPQPKKNILAPNQVITFND